MILVKERYKELLSLTRLYLSREYKIKERKKIDDKSLSFVQKKPDSLASVNFPKKEFKQPSLPSTLDNAPLQPIALSPTSDSHFQTPFPDAAAQPSKPPPPPANERGSTPNPTANLLALEPLDKANTPVNYQDFNQFFRNHFPNSIIHEQIPCDSQARKIKNTWLNEQVMPPIILLSFQEEEKPLAFLKNMARAISLRLAPVRIYSASKLEKNKEWEKILTASTLRLVIASDYGVYSQPGLMNYYREIPEQSKHFLLQIPLLLVSDLSLYLKEPQLKSLLWRAICNEFAATQAK